MKTMKLIFALSLAMIFAMGFNNAFASINPGTDKQAVKKVQLINYTVRIENANLLRSFGRNFMIFMTDGAGHAIAPPQSFEQGISDYQFYEPGNVRGTRVAHIVQVPYSAHSMMMPPTSRSGVFYGGASYLFIIKIMPYATEEVTDTH
jgi:hypothetical protein